MAPNKTFLVLTAAAIFVVPCLAGEYCTYYSSSHGQSITEYCSGYCCDTETDNCCSDYGLVIGLVIGGVILLAVVIALVCILYQKKKRKQRRTIQVTRISTTTVPNNRQSRTRVRNVGDAGMVAPPPYSVVNNSSYQPYSDPSYPPPPPYPGTPVPPYQPNNSSYPGVGGPPYQGNPAPPYQPINPAYSGVGGPAQSHGNYGNAGQFQSSGLQTNQRYSSSFAPPPVS